MEQIRVIERVLIAGKMRDEGEVVSLYPWQARRLEQSGHAERVNERVEQGAKDAEEASAADELTQTFGEDLALTLKDAGYESVEQVRDADGDELLAVNGIGQATLRKVRKHDGSAVEPEA